MSYADAIQAVPQDWHIEFSLNGKTILNETTIYRAVHSASGLVEEHTNRSVWSAIHPINFKRVPGPPPPEPSSLSQITEVAPETTASGIPASLDKHPATSSILRLLNILHALNVNLDDVLAENKDMLKLNVEPPSQFVNTKLTAKLNRQLEEPLIVASNCLPSWSEGKSHTNPSLCLTNCKLTLSVNRSCTTISVPLSVRNTSSVLTVNIIRVCSIDVKMANCSVCRRESSRSTPRRATFPWEIATTKGSHISIEDP